MNTCIIQGSAASACCGWRCWRHTHKVHKINCKFNKQVAEAGVSAVAGTFVALIMLWRRWAQQLPVASWQRQLALNTPLTA